MNLIGFLFISSLFNFQGPIFYTLNRLALARLSQVLCNYTTTFFVCQHLFLSFLKNFLSRFPNLCCVLLLVALSLRLTHITTYSLLCQQVFRIFLRILWYWHKFITKFNIYVHILLQFDTIWCKRYHFVTFQGTYCIFK